MSKSFLIINEWTICKQKTGIFETPILDCLKVLKNNNCIPFFYGEYK
jgi:hypothetical protein